MMHQYSQLDTRRCLRYLAYYGQHNHFVFVGDSRVRQLYSAFLSNVEPGDAQRPTASSQRGSRDLLFEDSQLMLRVEFLWRPTVSEQMAADFLRWKKQDDPPSVIVVGCAIQTMVEGNGSTDALNEYSMNLTYLVQAIDAIVEKKRYVLWALQAPVNEEKLPASLSMVTNKEIDVYNKAAVEVLRHSAAQVWASARLVARGTLDESADGLHLGPLGLRHAAQILLNLHCNDNMNFDDGTCCSSAEPYTALQVVTFSLLGVCLATAVALWLHRRWQRWKGTAPVAFAPLSEHSKQAAATDARTLLACLARMAVIMAYFYLCDRTNFFMKQNKYYTPVSFWLPFAYIFALGLFFTDDSRSTKVLHREQTDEWKGWMQLVILIYHNTGASGVLPIYMLVRVLVAAYLFLAGYGHFCHFWHTGDAGLVRFFQVMFRLNFVTVMMCLCMNRPYQFYYYVPLVSFWFFMAYLVMALPPRVTAASSESNPLQLLYLVLKLVGLFGVITVLYMSEVFFEKVFVTRPWKALFVTTDDDIHEWWHRWKLDRYSISYGMVFAVAYLLAQRYSLLDDNNHSNIFSPRIALLATLLLLAGLGSYAAFALLCHNKQECNEIHSYTVFVPVVSYVVLRNISGVLRTRHSSFFAWFGRISLEMFICQSHVWLAADTHGVLVLLPGYPVLNSLVAAFVFVCVAHEAHRITHTLVPYAVPPDWRLVLRNVLLFLAVLVPIGIHDGMF
ncbi:N-acetylneuraminate 9-O-acetyltransferase isoform X2 [Bacillus rossius redtenbacheri]